MTTLKTPYSFSRRTLLGGGTSALVLPGAAWGQGSEREIEGGIGGTGIVGVVTRVDRLVVGGYRVALTGGTRFEGDFGRLAASDLRLGQSLTVEAGPRQGGLGARRVYVNYPLIGTVTRVSNAGKTAVVNGTRVQLSQAIGARAVTGRRVAVSGIWKSQDVIASRIDTAAAGQDLVSGTVFRGPGVRSVGPVPVTGLLGQGLPAGQFAAVRGRYDTAQQVMQTQASSLNRFRDRAGDLARLSIEGWLEPVNQAPGYRVSGLGHKFSARLDLTPYVAKRMLFRGEYNGAFDANTAWALPRSAQQRARFLSNLSQSG